MCDEKLFPQFSVLSLNLLMVMESVYRKEYSKTVATGWLGHLPEMH